MLLEGLWLKGGVKYRGIDDGVFVLLAALEVEEEIPSVAADGTLSMPL
jgi:hypothetical protein